MTKGHTKASGLGEGRESHKNFVNVKRRIDAKLHDWLGGSC
jgi:hypothetical protein